MVHKVHLVLLVPVAAGIGEIIFEFCRRFYDVVLDRDFVFFVRQELVGLFFEEIGSVRS